MVTGTTGFLGTNIAINLLEHSYKVRAFGLPGSPTKYIEKEGVKVVLGISQFHKTLKKPWKV